MDMPINAKSAIRRLALFCVLTAIIGLGAASAASAATKVPIWSQNGTHLPFGTEVSYSGSAVSGMDLRWTFSGAPFWIECDTLSASGNVENYASGKAGTLKPTAGAKFQGCRLLEAAAQNIWEGTTCSVPSEIPLEVTSGELTNTPFPNGGLKLSNVLVRFKISNCPSGFFETLDWKFTGNLTGNEGYGAWPGEILIPEESPITVNNGAYNAKIDFGMNIEGAGSTHIKVIEEEIVEPHTPGHRYWYTGGGMRKGEGPRTLVPTGSPLAIKGSGNNITIKGTLAGLKTKVSCSNGTTAGSVENPAGGGDGTTTVTYGFTGCSVVEPAGRGCVIQGGAISLEPVTGALLEPVSLLTLSSTAPKESLALVPISGCKGNSPPTASYPFKGVLKLTQSAWGSWSIPEAQNEKVRLGGNLASVYGMVAAEASSNGEVVSWAE